MTAVDTKAIAGAEAILSVRGLVKNFGGLKAINDVAFDALPAQITALIGPNGAGKTTVFNLITNIMPRDAGQVMFQGCDLARLTPVRISNLGGEDRWPRPDPHLSVGAGVSRHDRDRKRHGRRSSPWPSFVAEPDALDVRRA
jgi:ABC-type oligopeptide transport system ATPase subunit